MRCSKGIEFPITLGRDFAGVVVQKGMSVKEKFEIGDKIWGVVPVHKTGCHADYVALDANCMSHKPENISDIDAAGLLYVGLTAWSALFVTGQLSGLLGPLVNPECARGKRICVLGASGGVGSVAVQMAKAENVHVVASCATDAIPSVQILGADQIVDYTTPDAIEKLTAFGPYDLILDCAGKGMDYATQLPWKFDQYVTCSSPLLRNIDSHGLGIGMVQNVVDLVEQNVLTLAKNRGLVKWAFFLPSPQGIDYIKKLVERNKVNIFKNFWFQINVD